MAIRKGTFEDLPAFEYLDNLCFPKKLRYSKYDFIYYFFKQNVFTLVSESDGRMNAFVIAGLRSNGEGHIITIDVHPSHRRTGLGRQLMAEVEKTYKSINVERIVLEVHQDNVLAQLFYSAQGYRIEKRLKNYYHTGDGLLLSKELSRDKSS